MGGDQLGRAVELHICHMEVPACAHYLVQMQCSHIWDCKGTVPPTLCNLALMCHALPWLQVRGSLTKQALACT